ncbi:VPLPA-CTERM sorting domain-containing protein [Microbulbifer sp. S227A]|uniref:VPLPA-CTERM sorting domain-containing protein n=1 Tax=Microbulbifer sp. S227A TaxID=3415131 RepID=UPI003C7AF7DC
MNKSKFLTTCAAGAILVATASIASAATINLGGADARQSELSYSVDGIGVTVTAEYNFNGWRDSSVTRNSSGLGAYSHLFDNPSLDGIIDERMTFTFDQDVSMEAINFANFGWSDSYDIYVDSGAGMTLLDSSSSNPYSFSPYLVGSSLTIGVDGALSSFRVNSLEVSAVPLPASGLLLLGGLGGIAALRRRRKS